MAKKKKKVVFSIELPENTQRAVVALWELTRRAREYAQERDIEELTTFTLAEVSKMIGLLSELEKPEESDPLLPPDPRSLVESEAWLRNAERAGIIERWEDVRGYPEFFFDDCVEIIDYEG